MAIVTKLVLPKEFVSVENLGGYMGQIKTVRVTKSALKILDHLRKKNNLPGLRQTRLE